MLWTQNTDLYEADNTDDNVQLDWSGCGMLETSGRGEGNRSIRHQNCLSQITVHRTLCIVHSALCTLCTVDRVDRVLQVCYMEDNTLEADQCNYALLQIGTVLVIHCSVVAKVET